MTDRKTRSLPFANQLLLTVMAAVLLYLVLSFIKQVGVSYQRRQELARIEERLAAALTDKIDLETSLDYARSDAAVEAWARENGMSRPNEVLMAPVGSSTEPVPTVQKDSGLDVEPDPAREAWWNLFFGAR